MIPTELHELPAGTLASGTGSLGSEIGDEYSLPNLNQFEALIWPFKNLP